MHPTRAPASNSPPPHALGGGAQSAVPRGSRRGSPPCAGPRGEALHGAARAAAAAAAAAAAGGARAAVERARAVGVLHAVRRPRCRCTAPLLAPAARVRAGRGGRGARCAARGEASARRGERPVAGEGAAARARARAHTRTREARVHAYSSPPDVCRLLPRVWFCRRARHHLNGGTPVVGSAAADAAARDALTGAAEALAREAHGYTVAQAEAQAAKVRRRGGCFLSKWASGGVPDTLVLAGYLYIRVVALVGTGTRFVPDVRVFSAGTASTEPTAQGSSRTGTT